MPFIQFAQATFKPGQATSAHSHSDMTEVYYILSGIGELQVDDETSELEPGVCIAVHPLEMHTVRNTGTTDLCMVYFGVLSSRAEHASQTTGAASLHS